MKAKFQSELHHKSTELVRSNVGTCGLDFDHKDKTDDGYRKVVHRSFSRNNLFLFFQPRPPTPDRRSLFSLTTPKFFDLNGYFDDAHVSASIPVVGGHTGVR